MDPNDYLENYFKTQIFERYKEDVPGPGTTFKTFVSADEDRLIDEIVKANAAYPDMPMLAVEISKDWKLKEVSDSFYYTVYGAFFVLDRVDNNSEESKNTAYEKAQIYTKDILAKMRLERHSENFFFDFDESENVKTDYLTPANLHGCEHSFLFYCPISLKFDESKWI